MIFVVLAVVLAAIVTYALSMRRTGQLLDQFKTARRKATPRRRSFKEEDFFPTHHSQGGYVNGDYNADLDRYGKWYGVDADDDDAKRNLLSDLDQDEDEDRRG